MWDRDYVCPNHRIRCLPQQNRAFDILDSGKTVDGVGSGGLKIGAPLPSAACKESESHSCRSNLVRFSAPSDFSRSNWIVTVAIGHLMLDAREIIEI